MMIRIFSLFISFSIVIACGRFNNNDQKQNQPNRIVCIAKQYTEIIFALGAQQDIVAVDISSTFPEQAKQLPTVGYHRALSAEAILAATPSLIIHDNNIGPDHVIQQLEKLEIPMKVFQNKGNTIDSTILLIKEMGEYFGKQHQADSICKKLEIDMSAAKAAAQQYQDSVKVLVIHYGQASNVYLVMTKKSTAAKMIEWAGGSMAVDDVKGMRQLSAEVITAANPDVILLTDFGYDRLGISDKIKELPGVAGTKAAINNRIFRVEEHDLVYLGPRTGENVMLLQKLLHQ